MWREGVIREIGPAWSTCVQVEIDLTEPLPDGRQSCPALAYTDLVGTPSVGDRALLNVTALARNLGTGGFALIVAFPDALPPDGPQGPGHLIKARYTPMQTMVLGVDEQEAATHDVLAEANDLDGMPIVAADLHSALPAIILGARARNPKIRIGYVMSDGATLPLQFSKSVAALRSENLLASTVTVGQSFGGDCEAVSVHTGLLALKHVEQVDCAVVVQGPGNLGSGTPWGFSGIAAADALHAASVLGGRPIGSLRMSGADPRDRHRGISHHSMTVYGRALLCDADIVVPGLDSHFDEVRDVIEAQLTDLFGNAPHLRRIDIDTGDLFEVLEHSPIPLSTMGRDFSQDPIAFLSAAAAGFHAADVN